MKYILIACIYKILRQFLFLIFLNLNVDNWCFINDKLFKINYLGTWQKPKIGKTLDTNPIQSNVSTIAIVPISDDVPLTSFTYELFHSLCTIGSTLRLTSEFVKNVLGNSIMDYKNEFRLLSWLAHQEGQYKIVIYVCDNTFSFWTQRCLRQADIILLVSLGNKEPILGKVRY